MTVRCHGDTRGVCLSGCRKAGEGGVERGEVFLLTDGTEGSSEVGHGVVGIGVEGGAGGDDEDLILTEHHTAVLTVNTHTH